MTFSIVHAISHRMRLRSAESFSLEFAEYLADTIEKIDNIIGVQVNARTGSVLFVYANEEAQLEVLTFILSLKDCDEDDVDLSAYDNLPAVQENEVKPPSLKPFFIHFCVNPLLPLVLTASNTIIKSIHFIKDGIVSLFKLKLNVEVLDATAILISLLRRDFSTAGLLMILLEFSEGLEAWTRKVSLDKLADSLDMNFETFWVRRGKEELYIPIAQLEEKDLVIARAGSFIPVDGIVEDGEALVNQASMTGEPLPVHRKNGNSVFAGTVVEEGELFIRPTKIGSQTRLNKIITYIEESEKLKANIEGKAERLANIAVPFTFALAGLTYLFTRNIVRATSVLLVDYSCALKLATPLALLTAMRKGTEKKVIIKGGRFIEALASATCIVFDKTGTLTNASPHVAHVVSTSDLSREEVLKVAACLEEHFPHPLARAVVKQAEAENLKHEEEHAKVDYILAHGIASTLHGKKIVLGSYHYIFGDEKVPLDSIDKKIKQYTDQGFSILYLAIGGKLAGFIALDDPLREEAKDVIKALYAKGIKHIAMLTGDDARVAERIAKELNLSDFKAQVLPTDKSEYIQELQRKGEVVIMVGDGMNDAPALSMADASVTLKESADLAQEIAGVILANDDLNDLLEAIDLARFTMAKIQTNFRLVMGLNSLFLAGGLAGVLSPRLAAGLHNSSTAAVCLNAMRSKA